MVPLLVPPVVPVFGSIELPVSPLMLPVVLSCIFAVVSSLPIDLLVDLDGLVPSVLPAWL